MAHGRAEDERWRTAESASFSESKTRKSGGNAWLDFFSCRQRTMWQGVPVVPPHPETLRQTPEGHQKGVYPPPLKPSLCVPVVMCKFIADFPKFTFKYISVPCRSHKAGATYTL